jgi:hypothetical protein
MRRGFRPPRHAVPTNCCNSTIPADAQARYRYRYARLRRNGTRKLRSAAWPSALVRPDSRRSPEPCPRGRSGKHGRRLAPGTGRRSRRSMADRPRGDGGRGVPGRSRTRALRQAAGVRIGLPATGWMLEGGAGDAGPGRRVVAGRPLRVALRSIFRTGRTPRATGWPGGMPRGEYAASRSSRPAMRRVFACGADAIRSADAGRSAPQRLE